MAGHWIKEPLTQNFNNGLENPLSKPGTFALTTALDLCLTDRIRNPIQSAEIQWYTLSLSADSFLKPILKVPNVVQLKISGSLCPQLWRSWGGILVSGRWSALAFVCPFVTLFDACHIIWTMHARILKFHIWIPHGKIADPYFLLVRVISLFGDMPLWKNQNEILSARYLKKYLS